MPLEGKEDETKKIYLQDAVMQIFCLIACFSGIIPEKPRWLFL